MLLKPKDQKRIRTKREADKALDRKENAKVLKRSEGQCEVRIGAGCDVVRCPRSATQVHHMVFGRGVRGRGESAFAERKQAVCDQCHDDIHGKLGGKKLRRIGLDPYFTDCYERMPSKRHVQRET